MGEKNKRAIAIGIIAAVIIPIVVGFVATVLYCCYMAVTESPRSTLFGLGAIIFYYSFIWAWRYLELVNKW